MGDAEWIAAVLAPGLLTARVLPSAPQRERRGGTRARAKRVEKRGPCPSANHLACLSSVSVQAIRNVRARGFRARPAQAIPLPVTGSFRRPTPLRTARRPLWRHRLVALRLCQGP